MIFYILVFVIFLLLIHLIFNYNYKARIVRRIPGPDLKFIVGNALDINIPSDDLFIYLRALASRYNGIYMLHGFPITTVHIYNPEDIEIITSNIIYHQKDHVYKLLSSWLQDGLLLSNGTKWQQRRKTLTSAFHFNVLKTYFIAMQENGKHLVKKLKTANGEAIDVIPTISEYTLNTICETAMGVQLDKSDAGYKYKKAIYGLGEVITKRLTNVYYTIDWIYNFTLLKRLENKHVSIIHNFSKNIIEKRKVLLKNKAVDDINEDDSKYYMRNKKRSAMLDLLIAAEKEGYIDSKGVQEEVDTFIFEGHDTTAAGLTYFLLLLANHPKIQDKVIEEQDDIFGKDDRNATTEDLALMRYLECCIKESLRLYPPVPLIARRLKQEVKLSNYTVPPETMITIHIFDLHRREDIFKDAHKFDPNRFLPENSIGRHNYAYIPFSAGPRNCIGQKFALMEMKSVLSQIFRNFKLAPVTVPSDVVFTADIVLRNNGPIYIKFIERLK